MTIASLKLYHYPLSRSARVKFLLHELRGEDFEVHKMAMMKGEAMTPAFLAKNPNHAVPVLEVGYEDGSSQTLIESGAMMVWLADAHDKLAPTIEDLPARADYLQMMFFGCAHMDMLLWQIRLHETLFPEAMRSAATSKFNRDKIEKEIAPQLAARLEAHPYICGEIFTAADCVTAQNVNWARAYGLCRTPVFDAYMSRISKREGFKLAFADASEFER
ncbi:MAG: glutathione S-transferase family protein [Alphaproteobacteria bacterium]